MLGELSKQPIRHFEHLAINDAQFAAMFESIEASRQLGAWNELDDHARFMGGIVLGRAVFELAIELVGLDD
jgi:hypothetical protein